MISKRGKILLREMDRGLIARPKGNPLQVPCSVLLSLKNVTPPSNAQGTLHVLNARNKYPLRIIIDKDLIYIFTVILFIYTLFYLIIKASRPSFLFLSCGKTLEGDKPVYAI
jgi:hypothetical protein